MKRIFLTIAGVLALANSAKAMSADEAAMAALYPEHETFFHNELHPVAAISKAQPNVELLVWTYVQTIQAISIKHVSELAQ